jgi:hypothetical protein
MREAVIPARTNSRKTDAVDRFYQLSGVHLTGDEGPPSHCT